MDNTYKISNRRKELIGLLSNIIIDCADKNGTDILLGKFNKENDTNIKREKEEFDKICNNNITTEPEFQISLYKYKIKEKDYYHICMCSNDDIKSIINREKTDISKNNKLDKDKIEKKEKIILTDRQIEIIEIVRKNPYIKYDDLKEILGISKGTICTEIRLLKRLKILERIGTNDGKWIINKMVISQ